MSVVLSVLASVVLSTRSLVRKGGERGKLVLAELRTDSQQSGVAAAAAVAGAEAAKAAF